MRACIKRVGKWIWRRENGFERHSEEISLFRKLFYFTDQKRYSAWIQKGLGQGLNNVSVYYLRYRVAGGGGRNLLMPKSKWLVH